MTWVGSGCVMAAGLPSRGSPDEPAGVDTSYRRPEPALAAIRSVRFYAWDATPRSLPAILRTGQNACCCGRPTCPSCLPVPPTWQNVLLLVAGAILASVRTVTAALRILWRQQETDFPIYHGVLNKAVWSSRAVAGWLLCLMVGTFLSADAAVVIGIDDTIERRGGRKSARAASTAIRSVLRRDTSSRPAACAGCPHSCSSTYPGPAASWAFRSSPCLHRPSKASTRTSRAHPR